MLSTIIKHQGQQYLNETIRDRQQISSSGKRFEPLKQVVRGSIYNFCIWKNLVKRGQLAWCVQQILQKILVFF